MHPRGCSGCSSSSSDSNNTGTIIGCSSSGTGRSNIRVSSCSRSCGGRVTAGGSIGQRQWWRYKGRLWQ